MIGRSSSTGLITRHPWWLKRFVIGWVVATWAWTLYAVAGHFGTWSCSSDDLRSKLVPSHPERAYAVICAAEARSQSLSGIVPELLALVDDDSDATQSHWPGLSALYGAKSYGTRRTVGYFARQAVERATPEASSVKPIVEKFVEHANRMKPTILHAQMSFASPTEESIWLFQLLGSRYNAAGLRETVAQSLIDQVGAISNDVFWRHRDRTDQTMAQRLDAITKGRSSVVNSQLEKHAVEREIELRSPPKISKLPEAARGPMIVARSQESMKSESYPERRGEAWSLRQDESRATPGWATVWQERSTACSESLPVLCISQSTAADAPLSWSGLERLGIFAAAIDARLALTAPVVGSKLSSRLDGDAMCKKQHGPKWRIAERNDGMSGRLPENAWRLAEFYYVKGDVFSARADAQTLAAMAGTKFWIEANVPGDNCWDP
jgi:hypothetical protein